jgi:hypothetical protein
MLHILVVPPQHPYKWKILKMNSNFKKLVGDTFQQQSDIYSKYSDIYSTYSGIILWYKCSPLHTTVNCIYSFEYQGAHLGTVLN